MFIPRATMSGAALFLMLAMACQGTVLLSDSAAAKKRPVTKVITLLKDMLKQMEKEAEEDEDIYQKLACWCETNEKEKTKSMADAETRIKQLMAVMEKSAGGSGRLNAEIAALEKEVAENTEALEKATAIRTKQLAEFNADEKDMLQSISALRAAVTVLGKHNSASLLQLPRGHMDMVAASVQTAMQKHGGLMREALSHKDRKTIVSFIQQPEDFMDAESTFKESHAPQSGAIFGIINQMKETFETNLASVQKEEAANQQTYTDLKKAKDEEIAAGAAQVDTKKEEATAADEKRVNAREDLEDTKASLAADEEFLAVLKQKCAMTDSEWEKRQKTRQMEMEAVSKALAILSGDDAHDLFTKTFNKFLQVDSAENSANRNKVYKYLLSQVEEHPRFATLAVKVRIDSFKKVLKAIDDMIVSLDKEKHDDIKKKEFCVEEFNRNEMDTAQAKREQEDEKAKIEKLEDTIKELRQTIKKLGRQIDDLNDELKKAADNRAKENQEFQVTVADQQATQKLLGQALEVLQGFYGAALVQNRQPAGPPPPPGFNEYKKSAGSGNVMDMIQNIMADAKAMEVEATHAEEEALVAYQDFVKETEKSIEAKNKDKVDKEELKAKTDSALVEENRNLQKTTGEIESLGEYNTQLHNECDFLIKNFDIRQEAREQEVLGLQKSKNILLGGR